LVVANLVTSDAMEGAHGHNITSRNTDNSQFMDAILD
jgi:hypothetical protein